MPTTKEIFKTAKEKGMVIEINDNIKLIKEFDNQYHCEITTMLDGLRRRTYRNIPTTHTTIYDKAEGNPICTDYILLIRSYGATRGHILLNKHSKILEIRIYEQGTPIYKRKTNKLLQKFKGRYIEVG